MKEANVGISDEIGEWYNFCVCFYINKYILTWTSSN